jgi:hypothetical protein
MHVSGADIPRLQTEEDQMRRETPRVRKLYPFKKDMFGLPAAASERAAVRGDQDRPETPRGRGCGSECANPHP